MFLKGQIFNGVSTVYMVKPTKEETALSAQFTYCLQFYCYLFWRKKKKRASQTFFCLDSGLLISSEKFINSLVCSLPGLTRNS